MLDIILVIASSFLIVLLMIPGIIKLALIKKLHDYNPNEPRKLGNRKISNLGGVAIFIALRLTQTFWIEPLDMPFNYFIAAIFIIFLVGLNDDLVGMSPLNRLIAQFLVASIIVIPGQIYFSNLNGFIGIYELSEWIGVVLSIIFIVGVINAFNLIDGIDGLAGSIGFLASAFIGLLFFLNGDTSWALLCLAICGSLAAFLVFNFSPAKIYMGDSGAYIIGFVLAVSSIKLINQIAISPVQIFGININSAYGIIAALLMVPIFDTLRVFVLRIYQKNSPFKANTDHIHHKLLSVGFNHLQTTLILLIFTVLLVLLALLLRNFSINYCIFTLFITTLSLNLALFLYSERQKSLDKVFYK